MPSTFNRRAIDQTRTYDRASSVVFLKTHEPFGGLSNMAGGFPLHVQGTRIYTSEALYQACRFPHLPEVQRLIIEQASPMTAKMKSKPHRRNSRPDWDRVCVRVMRWCLRVKLVQNWAIFSELLLSTGDRPIVEESRRNDFWGAKPVDERTLVGMNVLGRLLMELREAIKSQSQDAFRTVEPLGISEFLLFARRIETVGACDLAAQDAPATAAARVADHRPVQEPARQASLFDVPYVQGTPPKADNTFAALGSVRVVDLKPYPAMKDSRVPWLGVVPEHWVVGSLRRKLRSYDGIKIGPFGSQLKLEQMSESGFKVYGQSNVIARDFVLGRKFVDKAKFDELSACEICPSDLVVTMMGTSGRCARVPDNAVPGIMDSHLIRLRPTAEIDRTFAARLIDEATYVKGQILVAGKGSIMHGLNSSMIKNLSIALPPLPEQAAIVRFIDHADQRIRRYIRAKQKLIKLLEEQKQAFIHRAVTRGLDANVRLKPSGVERLGDMPEHWEIVRLKEVTTALEQGWSPQCDAQPAGEGEWGVLKVGCVNRGEFDPQQNKRLPETWELRPGLEIRDGDILVSRANTRELLGLAAVAVDPRPKLLLCDKLFRFRASRDKADERFLVHSIRQRTSRAQIESSTNGASDSMQNIGQQVVRNLRLLLPPIEEQRQIVNALDTQISALASAIAKARREIFLLREYRTRLIADVVTGKLDVRRAAAKLPTEPDEFEALDETDDLADEATGSVDDLDAENDEVEA